MFLHTVTIFYNFVLGDLGFCSTKVVKNSQDRVRNVAVVTGLNLKGEVDVKRTVIATVHEFFHSIGQEHHVVFGQECFPDKIDGKTIATIMGPRELEKISSVFEAVVDTCTETHVSRHIKRYFDGNTPKNMKNCLRDPK
ncbi:hypothetical protein Ddc_13560 [Ditylenchus destructor]|nr:hypothetical protein Ddc_13560 [Ditylenchus destructor]